MKNIHVLPTDKPSRFFNTNTGEFHFREHYVPDTIQTCKNHNIYITSDEEIKEGDWVIEFQKGDNIGEVHFINGEYVIANDIQKKIILTTDQDLIKDGVQSIDDNFLEWFVKNPSCEKVEVVDDTFSVREASKLPLGTRNHKYKIIIPKETKEETLEEAAERILANNIDGLRDALKDDDLFYFYKGVIQSYGESMAQYQAKRMYSEEEVLKLVDGAFHMYASSKRHDAKEWLVEQFKKK